MAQGMNLEAILKYFEQLKALKLDIDYQYRGTIELIKQYIDNNIPVLWLHNAPAGRMWGRHVAVVIGYDDTTRKMIIADPAYGAEIAMPYAEFLRRWHGTSELMIAVTSKIWTGRFFNIHPIPEEHSHLVMMGARKESLWIHRRFVALALQRAADFYDTLKKV